jgi:hypothetical protein
MNASLYRAFPRKRSRSDTEHDFPVIRDDFALLRDALREVGVKWSDFGYDDLLVERVPDLEQFAAAVAHAGYRASYEDEAFTFTRIVYATNARPRKPWRK